MNYFLFFSTNNNKSKEETVFNNLTHNNALIDVKKIALGNKEHTRD